MAEGLSAKDERIADLSASGFKPAQIAADTGIGLTTVYAKLRQPLVRARIAEARAAVLRPILEVVQAELIRNVEVLATIRDADKATNRDRIAAVQELNTMFYKLGDITEVRTRLAHFEAVLPEASE